MMLETSVCVVGFLFNAPIMKETVVNIVACSIVIPTTPPPDRGIGGTKGRWGMGKMYCARHDIKDCPYRGVGNDIYSHWIRCGYSCEKAISKAEILCKSTPCLFAIEVLLGELLPGKEWYERDL